MINYYYGLDEFQKMNEDKGETKTSIKLNKPLWFWCAEDGKKYHHYYISVRLENNKSLRIEACEYHKNKKDPQTATMFVGGEEEIKIVINNMLKSFKDYNAYSYKELYIDDGPDSDDIEFVIQGRESANVIVKGEDRKKFLQVFEEFVKNVLDAIDNPKKEPEEKAEVILKDDSISYKYKKDMMWVKFEADKGKINFTVIEKAADNRNYSREEIVNSGERRAIYKKLSSAISSKSKIQLSSAEVTIDGTNDQGVEISVYDYYQKGGRQSMIIFEKDIPEFLKGFKKLHSEFLKAIKAR